MKRNVKIMINVVFLFERVGKERYGGTEAKIDRHAEFVMVKRKR